MSNKIRLAGILFESLVNGPGVRRVFFSQGCKHNCKGCFNTHTHDFNIGQDFDMDELIEATLVSPFTKGVTFSGGDPFERAEQFAYMAKKFKEHGINIWSYTGYTYEYILDNLDRPGWKELINNLDVLVDGKFEEDKQQDGLMYRGSSNQRLIDIPKTIKTNTIVYYMDDINNKGEDLIG